MQNETATLEDNWAFFFAQLHILLPYDPATEFLGIYSNKLKLMATKNLHLNVYSDFIHNGQNLEATEMSFSK